MMQSFPPLLILMLAAGPALAVDSAIDFSRDIQPIFVKHCVSCHGPDKQKGGLRLDLKSAAIQGGDTGPAFTVGKSNDSDLIKRVRGDEPDDIMPPKGDRLSKEQVALLAKWIDSGAVWPDDAALLGPGGRRRSDHWSFQPVKRPALPKVKETSWPRNSIDYFILEKLEAKGIKPSPQADPYTLVRRVYLDLLGILPTPEEADAFVKEYAGWAPPTAAKVGGTHPTKDPYEALVDRLLASSHYGERWGRHWLDQARYADSNGYSVDGQRTMWPFRDWVIDALNKDMPFDQFTIEQLAGDLLNAEGQGPRDKGQGAEKGVNPSALGPLPPALSRQIATAFHRNTMINQEGGVKDDQFRIEASYDRVATTSQVWLGLTLACAQCHTHKFDPFTQKEYYQFFAFFNSTEDSNNTGPTASLASPEDEKKLAEIKVKLAAAEAEHKAIKAGKELDRERAEAKKKVDAIKKELTDANSRIPSVMVMRELKSPRPSHIHIRGDFLRPGPAVTPDVPEVLPALVGSAVRTNGAASEKQPVRTAAPTGAKGTVRAADTMPIPTRLDLARWLVSTQNPLTPRVTMNRVWLRYFPKGLVETEEDFGTQGTPPTHPALLDWLASEFVGGKPHAAWSLKHMHRLIVTSATYRQSSHTRSDLAQVDPFNKLLARQSRLRVEAEIVRDLALSASGLLSKKIGGPSVRPPQPAGVYNFTQNQHGWTNSTGEDRYRRGMYTFFFRSAPHPMLTAFDVPNLTQTCTARLRSNTPLQSLTMANDEAMFEMAQGLAVRVMGDEKGPRGEEKGPRAKGQGPRDADADGVDLMRMERLFRLCLTRKPDAYESSRLLAYLKQQRERYTKDAAAAKLVAPTNRPKEVSEAEAAAWTMVARAVMNLDEFITRE